MTLLRRPPAEVGSGRSHPLLGLPLEAARRVDGTRFDDLLAWTERHIG